MLTNKCIFIYLYKLNMTRVSEEGMWRECVCVCVCMYVCMYVYVCVCGGGFNSPKADSCQSWAHVHTCDISIWEAAQGNQCWDQKNTRYHHHPPHTHTHARARAPHQMLCGLVGYRQGSQRRPPHRQFRTVVLDSTSSSLGAVCSEEPGWLCRRPRPASPTNPARTGWAGPSESAPICGTENHAEY